MIDDTTQEPRNGIVRKQIDLDKANVDWFNSQYNGVSLTWLFNRMLTHFRSVSEFTPEYYSKKATQSFVKDLEGNE